ncbi:HAMP domain-containing sensor histidine kinase [Erysipelothrix urinaevulpis]|uniref:sensor histidine kinase n=1 Tax=Erysipelothrix urinaevulpis TaxID=2683717 RepID=UPI00135BF5A7|nr:HAMP domain-containing sensor histidine kinase [Erysipelothrix urinaevulpis]
MRKLKDSIRKLSLTQQLVTIVVFTLVFFLVFFFGALSFKIDSFVDKQMYGLVHRSQQNVIYNYIRNLDDSALYGANDPNIIHVIGTKDGRYLSNGINRIDPDLINQIKHHMDAVEMSESVDYRFKDNSLYTITNIPNKDATIATLITKNYHDEFKTTLISSVINIILVVMGVVFLLLLIWVSSIIHPLNQIRDYINKIRKNKDAELNLNRGDEIGELGNVLVEMNEELQRQEKLKEEMIQNISHDLKTPIATIKSYGESIKDGVYPYETLEKSVDVIIEHAERLEKKVFNLLMLNRMDYMTHEEILEVHDIDLREIVERVIVSSSQIRPDVEIKLLGDEARIKGADEPWRVVFENLLDNALRYANSKVIIEINDNYLSVYNDGSSIDQERMDQLFKAYEIGEEGQFGLGLAIVNRVVNNYGYRIMAENIHEGVQFKIWKEGE